ncbi:MAG: hypothetical protein V1792_21620 [Pseudomonadota bacterium]
MECSLGGGVGSCFRVNTLRVLVLSAVALCLTCFLLVPSDSRAQLLPGKGSWAGDLIAAGLTGQVNGESAGSYQQRESIVGNCRKSLGPLGTFSAGYDYLSFVSSEFIRINEFSLAYSYPLVDNEHSSVEASASACLNSMGKVPEALGWATAALSFEASAATQLRGGLYAAMSGGYDTVRREGTWIGGCHGTFDFYQVFSDFAMANVGIAYYQESSGELLGLSAEAPAITEIVLGLQQSLFNNDGPSLSLKWSNYLLNTDGKVWGSLVSASVTSNFLSIGGQYGFDPFNGRYYGASVSIGLEL